MAQMQNLFYDEAPYHVLFYEDTLVAHRTDKFGGWTNQPANGVPAVRVRLVRLPAPDRRRGRVAVAERGGSVGRGVGGPGSLARTG